MPPSINEPLTSKGFLVVPKICVDIPAPGGETVKIFFVNYVAICIAAILGSSLSA